MIFMLATLFISCRALAQTRKVTGTVIDSGDKTAVIGASVTLKGTRSIVITDAEGKFSINIPNEESVITVSCLGYKSQDVAVGKRTRLVVFLAQNAEVLSDVVVIGYGTAKKRDLTGAVSSVSGDKLKESIVIAPDQLLQGKVAGVQVTSNSGAPGAATSIRIRGASSINNSNEPLYVIDGIPVSGAGTTIQGFDWAGGSNGQNRVNPLSTISPSDIVSIDVLKDASAAAIYGAAGANGVVLITTRRGKAGHSIVTYDGYVAVQTVPKKLDMMNLRDFAKYQKELYLNEDGVSSLNDAYRDPSILGDGTDWQDAIFRRAVMQSHQVAVTGGSEATQFAASAGYTQQDGIIIGSDFDRFNMRMNLDHNVNEWIKAGASLSYSRTNQKITLNDGGDGVVLQALMMPPDVPIYDFDGNFAGPNTTMGSSNYNPVALALRKNNTLRENRIMGNFYMELTFLKDIKLRSEYGFDGSNNINRSFAPRYSFGALTNNINKIMQRDNSSYYWIWKNYATYNHNFGKHNVNFMAGFETSESQWSYEQLIKTNLTSDNIHVITSDGDYYMNDGSKDKSTTVSAFGRLNYNYADKYYITFTERADASSKFGKNKRWGYFPSMALAWRASEEKFLKDVKWLSNLKFRLGYGLVGNSNIGTYLYGSAMTSIPSTFGTAYRMRNIANPDLKWEASEQYNAGMDLGLVKGRINLSVDVYKKQTKDLLMQVTVPSYLGGSKWNDISTPMVNIGKTENKGLDISLNTVNIQGRNFTWRTNAVFSLNKNKVVALNDDSQLIYSSLNWYSEFQTATVTKVGKPMGSFYGYVVDRLFKSEQDILDSPVQKEDPANSGKNLVNKTTGVWIGDIKFKDISGPDGKPDGVIDDYDQTIIGDPNPDFTWGMTNTFDYKQFELTIALTGVQGGDILNYGRVQTEGLTSIWDNQSKSVSKRARYSMYDEGGSLGDASNVYLANPETSIPRFATNDVNRNNRMSTRWIEDGTYIRIQNLTLAYNFSKSLLSKIKLQSLKVYVNIQNLYTITGYDGYDPEIGAYNQSALMQNIDMGRYPTPRIWTFGLNIGF